MTCLECEKRDQCKKPCEAVSKILWKDNHVMEKHFSDFILVFPGSTRERHFCELTDKQLEEISESDVIPWSSEDMNFSQTKVFVDRFFNRMPFKAIAEKYRVKENTAIKQYEFAFRQLAKIVSILDMRREGMRAMKPQKFTDDQKMFLLAHVFGFSQTEVADMFKIDRRVVNKIIGRLTEKYLEAFKEPVKKSAYDGLTVDEIKKRMTGQ